MRGRAQIISKDLERLSLSDTYVATDYHTSETRKEHVSLVSLISEVHSRCGIYRRHGVIVHMDPACQGRPLTGRQSCQERPELGEVL